MEIEVDQYASQEEDGTDLWEISNLTLEDLRFFARVLALHNLPFDHRQNIVPQMRRFAILQSRLTAELKRNSFLDKLQAS